MFIEQEKEHPRVWPSGHILLKLKWQDCILCVLWEIKVLVLGIYTFWIGWPEYQTRWRYLTTKNHRIGKIKLDKPEPLRILALVREFGILLSLIWQRKVWSFISTLNTNCDLPLACKPYGDQFQQYRDWNETLVRPRTICTFSEECSCTRLIKRGDGLLSDCTENVAEGFCGKIYLKC